MNSVYKCENYRLKRSKELKIVFFGMLILQFFLIVLNFVFNHMSFFKDMMDSSGAEIVNEGFFDGFGSVVVDGAYGILLLVTVCSLVTKLYQHGITKQLVSSGITRRSIILGQFFSFTLIYSIVGIILSITGGISNIIQGGTFNIADYNMARLPLVILAMVIVTANLVSINLLVSHLSTSMGGAIMLGLIINLGLPTAIFTLSLMLKTNIIADYFFGNLQSSVITMEGSLTKQLISMGILCIYTLVFLIITQIIFKGKEIR